jgi:hypothetical protein
MSAEDARVQGFTRGAGTSGVDATFQFTRQNGEGELFVAQGLPAYTEVTRRGIHWSLMSATTVAALVARPTTTAAFEIWNGNSAASLIVTRLMALEIVATAAANGAGIWAQVTAAKATPTAGAHITRSNNGKAYSGLVVSAASTTVVDSGWFPWGPPMVGPATATPGPSWEARVDGALVVPPGSSLCLHVVASLVGDTFITGASFIEAVLTNA